MDYYKANSILLDYVNEIAKDELFHSLSHLKHTKEEVIKAFKVNYIHMVKHETHTSEHYEQEVMLLIHLNTFFNHDDYLELNGLENKEDREIWEHKKMYDKGMKKLFAWDAYEEVTEFVNMIIKLDRNDPLFYQRAYTYAGIEYKPEYKISMDRASSKKYKYDHANSGNAEINHSVSIPFIEKEPMPEDYGLSEDWEVQLKEETRRADQQYNVVFWSGLILIWIIASSYIVLKNPYKERIWVLLLLTLFITHWLYSAFLMMTGINQLIGKHIKTPVKEKADQYKEDKEAYLYWENKSTL